MNNYDRKEKGKISDRPKGRIFRRFPAIRLLDTTKEKRV